MTRRRSGDGLEAGAPGRRTSASLKASCKSADCARTSSLAGRSTTLSAVGSAEAEAVTFDVLDSSAWLSVAFFGTATMACPPASEVHPRFNRRQQNRENHFALRLCGARTCSAFSGSRLGKPARAVLEDGFALAKIQLSFITSGVFGQRI